MDERYAQLPEWDHHEDLIVLNEPDVGLKGFIGLHHSRSGFPSLGATRMWSYGQEIEAAQDALRLSRLMTAKSAMAGLPYGGAKAALVMTEKGAQNREALFARYAEKVNELRGRFVTGTDVGLQAEDLTVMVEKSPYMIGHEVDAGYYTAVGVYEAMKALLEVLSGEASAQGKRFAIQGLGKTGFELLKILLREGADQVFVADLNEAKCQEAVQMSESVQAVSVDDIHRQEVDVFCPCALSGAINEVSVDELQCSAVAGAANNQLKIASMGQALHERGILYAPDYLSNGGGLISVVDQFEHDTFSADRVEERLSGIGVMMRLLLETSQRQDRALSEVADDRMKELLAAEHLGTHSRKRERLAELCPPSTNTSPTLSTASL